LGPADDFSKNIFPKTPLGNGNLVRGLRALSESRVEVAQNSPPPKTIPGGISKTK
jgi:hypothetical protein